MISLTALVEKLDSEFKQDEVLLKLFDFETLKQETILQPRYLFRGERTINWSTSKSTFSRTLMHHTHFREINYYITGIIPEIGTIYGNGGYSLYQFLKEAIFDVYGLDQRAENPKIDLAIAGLMQHYGFETAMLDVTSDITIAASFAATGEVGDTGQIMVLETKHLEDQYFDLTKIGGNRPKKQSAFALWGSPDLDLKSSQFQSDYDPKWFKFKMTPDDKQHFFNAEMLSIRNDRIAGNIFDWYDTYVYSNDEITPDVADYFKGKVDELKRYL